MGLFSKLKNVLEQDRAVHIPLMEFRRYDEAAGSAVQRFADVSLPGCPLCGGDPRWLLHIANITTSMYPIQEVDRIYHLKCQCCGGVLHTKYHAIGSSLPNFVISPSPTDPVTRMVLDELGSSPRRELRKDDVYTILELNQL